MARSLASLVHDQAKRVADTADTLASNLVAVVATDEQKALFGNITQQLMTIRDQLAAELQRVLEMPDGTSTTTG